MESKVVLITGASSGIGAATAILLAQKGYKKLALVARRQDRLEQVKEQCLKQGAKQVLILVKDLGKTTEVCQDIIKETVAEFGRLDVLINNAGAISVQSVRDITEDEINRIFNLNLVSCMMLTKFALPELEKTKGNIVFVSSIAGSGVISKTMGTYQSSKAALNRFAKTVALEEAPKGIRSNIVSPAGTGTEIWVPKEERNDAKSSQAMSVMDAAGPLHALGRIATSEEVAEVIAFVASDANSFMTGSDVVVDGGGNLMTSFGMINN